MTWNIAPILSNLKSFKKVKILFEYDMKFFTGAIKCPHFLPETYHFFVFVGLKALVLFYLCFSSFYEFQCFFHKNSSVLTFIIGLFYFILAWSGLKSVRLKDDFSVITSVNSAIKDNPHMQLRLIFHKYLIERNWKSENFRVIVLVDFYSYHYFRLYT